MSRIGGENDRDFKLPFRCCFCFNYYVYFCYLFNVDRNGVKRDRKGLEKGRERRDNKRNRFIYNGNDRDCFVYVVVCGRGVFDDKMNKEEVKVAYHVLLKNMLFYNLNQVGSRDYAAELAGLEEKYPEIVAEIDKEEEEIKDDSV